MTYLIVGALILGLVVYISHMILQDSYKDYDNNTEPEPVKNYYEPIKSEVNITTEEIVEKSTGVIDLRKNKNIVAESVKEAVQVVKQDMLGYIGAPGENTTEPIKTDIEEAVIIEEVKPEVLKTPSKPRTRKPRAKKEVLK